MARPPAHVDVWVDGAAGLRAVCVLDDLTLGPAAGGIRCMPYSTLDAQLEDALGLARNMTLKCALGGVNAGGAKIVVQDHPGLERAHAFDLIGRRVAELKGQLQTAGDLGTTASDLAVAAQRSPHIHADETHLGGEVARGLLACVMSSWRACGHAGEPSSIAIQGVGTIGAAVARAAREVGLTVSVCDLDASRAEALAAELETNVVAPDAFFSTDVDVLAPCAVGGVLTTTNAPTVRAPLVAAGANRVLANDDAEDALLARGITVVPDVLTSAGAVVAGIAAAVMNVSDVVPLVEALGETAAAVIAEARAENARPSAVAAARAFARIDAESAG